MAKRAIFISGLAILGFLHPVQATEPTREDMQAQIDRLQAKVDRLEAMQDNLVTREQVDATVKQVMQDAEQRSQLFAPSDFTAGYSDGNSFFKVRMDGSVCIRTLSFKSAIRRPCSLTESSPTTPMTPRTALRFAGRSLGSKGTRSQKN